MHPLRLIGIATPIAAAIALLSIQVIPADLRNARTVSQQGAIDVMQIMREAKDLPVQAFDAI